MTEEKLEKAIKLKREISGTERFLKGLEDKGIISCKMKADIVKVSIWHFLSYKRAEIDLPKEVVLLLKEEVENHLKSLKEELKNL